MLELAQAGRGDNYPDQLGADDGCDYSCGR